MNPVLEKILETCKVESVDGKLIRLTSNIFPEEGELLQKIISEKKPKISLEVGLAYGVSALFIGEALKKVSGTRHIIIDPNQSTHWQNIGLNNLRKAGYEDIVEFYEEPSHIALPQLESQGVKVDFAFIDGYHTFDYTLVDFFHIDKLLNVGGIIAIDDANWSSIRKVCRYIATNLPYSVVCSLEPKYKISLKRQLFQRIVSIFKRFEYVLKPEFVKPDSTLGITPHSRCIVFRKEAEDTRRYDFHREF